MAEREVHEQTNGARIVVPRSAAPEPEPEAWEAPAAPSVPPSMATYHARLRAEAPPEHDGLPWAKPIAFGLAAAVLIGLSITTFEIATGWSLKLLYLGAGAGIGAAVRAGEPPGDRFFAGLLAIALAYLAIVLTWPYWMYQSLLEPEAWATIWELRADDLLTVDEDAPIASFDAPGGGGGATSASTVLRALGRSLVFPVYLVGWVDVFGILFTVTALGTAFKIATTAPKAA